MSQFKGNEYDDIKIYSMNAFYCETYNELY